MKSFLLTLVCVYLWGSEEVNARCGDDEFMCTFSHACIAHDLVCDGKSDCPHHEDEHGCPAVCGVDEFMCDGGLCISDIYYCDGHYDCSDKSDEKYCPEIRKSHTCLPNHFMCGEGTCIPSELVCDGLDDCMEGEDEHQGNCPTSKGTNATQVIDPECPSPNYRCQDASQTCIPQRFVCDDSPDCDDGSDEIDCGHMTHHTECLASKGLFACKKSTDYDHEVRCISADLICDGKPQCPHGEDEGNLCLANKCKDYGCEQHCSETEQGPSCYCGSGYTLGEDLKTCVDVDECQNYGHCDQLCHNTKGGFECACLENYSLVNGSFCQFNEVVEILVTLESSETNDSEIRSYNLHTREYLPLVSGLAQPVGVGYDLNNNRLFWTDAAPGRSVIEQASLLKNRTAAPTQVFLETGLEHPEDLVLDQATGLVYFTDSGKDCISVCSIVTSLCSILSEGFSQPRGLALHSRDRLLFVTEWGGAEWGSKPKIVVMNMDGSSVKTLIDTDIKWANGIAVDETIDRIFWADAQRDTIESATIEGTDRRVVVNDANHPFGVAVFEDRVYWSDWHENRLFSANKFNGRDIRVLLETHHRINGISIYHTVPTSVHNACFESQCSHLCIPAGVVSRISHTEQYSCKCPEDMHLMTDGLTCQKTSFSDPINSLIVASGNNLYSLQPQKLGKVVMESIGFETSLVTGLSSFVVKDILVATTSTGHVFNVNAHWKTSHLISIEGPLRSLSHDSLQSNLFWIDGIKKIIIIMSEHSKHMRTLVQCEDPKALTYVHSKNVVAFIDGSNLMEISLDGQRTTLLSGNVSPSANLLIYSEQAKTYFIAGTDGISLFTLGLGPLEPLVEKNIDPVSITVQGGYLYWTERESNLLSWTNIKRHSSDQTVYSMTLNISAKHSIFISSTVDFSDFPQGVCTYEACTDICVRSRDSLAVCMCADGRSIVQDDHWNTCKDDSQRISTILPDLSSPSARNKNALIGIIVSIVLVLTALVLLALFCCAGRPQRIKEFKPAQFINRSFGLSPTKHSTPTQEMCGVEVIHRGLTTEIENPGFTSVDLYNQNTPRCPPPPPNTPISCDKPTSAEKKEGVLPGLIRSIRSFRDPKMSAIDWSESSISYENLVAAKGSSTPRGLKRMDTIKEGDSAYTDMSTSLSFDDCSSVGSTDKNQLI